MRSISWLVGLLLLFIFSGRCRDNIGRSEVIVPSSVAVPDLEVPATDLVLMPTEGKWYYHGAPFFGYAITEYPNRCLREKIGYFEGKKQGVAKKWFADGQLQRKAFYGANRLIDTLKIWWPNGQMAARSVYERGSLHGEQCKWFPSGCLSKRKHFQMGKELGLQQAWLRNGALYVNYEARGGRIFGLRRSNLCYALKDEVVQYK